MKNPTQAEKGAADDIAAKQVGLSRPTAQKGAQVVHAIDQLIAEGKRDEAEQLRQILNGQSFEAAIQAATNAGHVKPPLKKPTAIPKPPADKKSGDKVPVDTPLQSNETTTETDSKGDDVEGANGNLPEGDEEQKPFTPPAGASDLPPLVTLTEAMNRFVDGHDNLDLGDVSNDQKWHFNRAFKGLFDWRENHAEQLKLPRQSLL